MQNDRQNDTKIPRMNIPFFIWGPMIVIVLVEMVVVVNKMPFPY